VVIKTPNTYTGPTTISEGTLQIGDGVTDGSIAATSEILNDGTLVYNRAGSFTYGGVISGIGSLVKSGPGSQALTKVSTYFGSTTVTGGVLSNGINNALPASTDLIVSGGAYDLFGWRVECRRGDQQRRPEDPDREWRVRCHLCR
jgi:fibronectin-binding autotransporter adhesin